MEVMCGRITSQDISRAGRNDERYRSVRLDPSTHAIPVVDYPHYEIHIGQSYYMFRTSSLASGAELGIAITTPNSTKWLHMSWRVTTSNLAILTMEEILTSYAGGVAFTPLNHNRNSLTGSDVTTPVTGETGATLISTVGGNVIWQEAMSGGNQLGGASNHDNEIILKFNSKYYFSVTSSANGNSCTLFLDWYEHTDKD